MKFISLTTKLLHYLPSEISHFIALKSLKILDLFGILPLIIGPIDIKNSNLKNLGKIENLKNRLGFAAGLDKNGEYVDCLAALGVGFIEIGTVTPRAQPGNKKPRLFRDVNKKSILNRLGFNNKGVDRLVSNIKARKSDIPIGISIGKNFDTSNDNAYEDYKICMKKVYEFSSYIAINISSPNTQDLRKLSGEEYLDSLLRELKKVQIELSLNFGYRPIFLKISPDENLNNIENICKLILKNEIDGIICTNTTLEHNEKYGEGGLSGKPLREKSTDTVITVKKFLGEEVTIIASGGVMSVADYNEKIASGADLVQIYTGFIFEGPKLVDDILNQDKHQRNT